jgi:hypothetical protein
MLMWRRSRRGGVSAISRARSELAMKGNLRQGGGSLPYGVDLQEQFLEWRNVDWDSRRSSLALVRSALNLLAFSVLRTVLWTKFHVPTTIPLRFNYLCSQVRGTYTTYDYSRVNYSSLPAYFISSIIEPLWTTVTMIPHVLPRKKKEKKKDQSNSIFILQSLNHQ